MKKIFILAYLAFSTPGEGFQPVITGKELDTVLVYQFRGNHFFSGIKLIEHLPPVTQKDFNADSITDLILENYRNEGFFFARVDSIRLHPTRIEIFLTENNPIQVDSVLVLGGKLTSPPAEISKWMTRPRRIFSPRLLEKDIEDLVDEYGNRGYPFATVWVERLDFVPKRDPDRVNILIGIDEKDFVRLSQIIVKGNNFTRSAVIQREMRIAENEVFRADKCLRIKRRLERLGYFKSVEEPELIALGKNQWGILQQVEEGNTSSFDGVIGYIPGQGTQKGFFTGLLDLTIKNFLGTGRRINVFWEKRSQDTQELRLHYEEPWIFHLPVYAGIGYEQLNQDSSYIRRSVNLQATYPVSESTSLFGKYGSTEIIPDSGSALSLGIPNSQIHSIGLGGELDLRDEPTNPRSGSFYSTSFELGFKSISGPDTLVRQNALAKHTQNQRIIVDLETYFPIRPRQVLALIFHGAEVWSTEEVVPISDQILFGGARSVRGYRENQFHATRVIWLKSEYRFLLTKRSRFFFFTDLVYFSRKEKRHLSTVQRKEDSMGGAGFGIRVETRLGLIGIDYGLGKGDGVSTGKIHLSVSNEF